jgi:hypothetical protein
MLPRRFLSTTDRAGAYARCSSVYPLIRRDSQRGRIAPAASGNALAVGVKQDRGAGLERTLVGGVLGSTTAATVRGELDDADPQAHAGHENGEREPLTKGETCLRSCATRPRVIALFVVPTVGVHHSSSRFVRHFRKGYGAVLQRKVGA